LSTISERARIDDKRSAAMEKRKQQGYFRMKFLKIFFGYFFSLNTKAQTEKNVEQSLLWARYYNQLE
jgi:hypothetical protein